MKVLQQRLGLCSYPNIEFLKKNSEYWIVGNQKSTLGKTSVSRNPKTLAEVPFEPTTSGCLGVLGSNPTPAKVFGRQLTLISPSVITSLIAKSYNNYRK